MTDMGDRIDKELDGLRQTRDQLRVQIHLAKADATDLWEELEGKFHKLESKANRQKLIAEDTLHNAGEAARLLLAEIREGYEKIRNTL